MALFRNIGNRLRRADDSTAAAVAMEANAMKAAPKPPPSTISVQVASDETPDLYSEDRPLGLSIRELEDVRNALQQLTASASAHKESLIATATTERALGLNLGDMLRLGNSDRSSTDSLTLPGSGQGSNGSTENTQHFARFLRSEDTEAQRELGRGLEAHAESTVKLANAFANPLADLQRSFEERFSRKIMPLRKRYIDQKGQYLKYRRNADIADNDERRSYFEALAEAAKPVWVRTSTELRTECNVMTELTARNMAKWSRSLALQHERALAIAAANFAEAFQQAKANNIPNSRQQQQR